MNLFCEVDRNRNRFITLDRRFNLWKLNKAPQILWVNECTLFFISHTQQLIWLILVQIKIHIGRASYNKKIAQINSFGSIRWEQISSQGIVKPSDRRRRRRRRQQLIHVSFWVAEMYSVDSNKMLRRAIKWLLPLRLHTTFVHI